jgi:hypothetical protein
MFAHLKTAPMGLFYFVIYPMNPDSEDFPFFSPRNLFFYNLRVHLLEEAEA